MFLPGGSGIAVVQDLSNPKLAEVHRRTLTDLSELLVSSIIRGDDLLSLPAGNSTYVTAQIFCLASSDHTVFGSGTINGCFFRVSRRKGN